MKELLILNILFPLLWKMGFLIVLLVLHDVALPSSSYSTPGCTSEILYCINTSMPSPGDAFIERNIQNFCIMYYYTLPLKVLSPMFYDKKPPLHRRKQYMFSESITHLNHQYDIKLSRKSKFPDGGPTKHFHTFFPILGMTNIGFY